jgi:cytoskeletal protein RodZ
MVENAGRKLQQTRLRKQISIEDAARATRMRPDKIIDLENDNYTNFPNVAYAKGFLLIYAKFLGVDVSEYAETLESANPVAIDDYAYLNAPIEHRSTVHYAPQKNSLIPLMVIAVVVVVAAFLMYLVLSFQRLGPLDQIAEKPDGIAPGPSAAASVPPPNLAPAVPSRENSTPVASPLAPVDSHGDQAALSTPAASAAPAAPPALATPSPVAPTPKEITLKPSKKTWVKIRKDVQDSAPVFEDWLYPDAPPLKLRGGKFWIELKDPGAVTITRDGQPVSSNQPSLVIE